MADIEDIQERDFAVECEPKECPICLYGQIPEDFTITDLDVAYFILDKADIPYTSERRIE